MRGVWDLDPREVKPTRGSHNAHRPRREQLAVQSASPLCDVQPTKERPTSFCVRSVQRKTGLTPPTYDLDAMQFRTELAVEALTDPSRLEGVFIWERAPEVREFWEQQASGLTVRGRDVLRFLIEASMQLTHLNLQRRAA